MIFEQLAWSGESARGQNAGGEVGGEGACLRRAQACLDGDSCCLAGCSLDLDGSIVLVADAGSAQPIATTCECQGGGYPEYADAFLFLSYPLGFLIPTRTRTRDRRLRRRILNPLG